MSSEQRGMLISGVSSFTVVSVYAGLLSESGLFAGKLKFHEILNAATAVSIPASLMGATIGYLFGKRHHKLKSRLSLSAGIAWSQLKGTVRREKWSPGLEIKVGVIKIGRLEYHFAFNHYFLHRYQQFGQEARNSAWETAINLSFPVNLETLTVTPYLGYNLFSNRESASDSLGFRYGITHTDWGTNLGMTLDLRLSRFISLRGESRFTITSEHSRWTLSMGASSKF